jgi:DNA-binding NtrC family response regulator
MKTRKILVIDDDEIVQEVVRQTLSADDRIVFPAISASEARRMLQWQRFDVVLLDLCLPDENGIELLSHIKDHYHLPVIVMTAFGNWETHIEAYRLGAYYYLDKPFKVTHVRSLVDLALWIPTLQ